MGSFCSYPRPLSNQFVSPAYHLKSCIVTCRLRNKDPPRCHRLYWQLLPVCRNSYHKYIPLRVWHRSTCIKNTVFYAGMALSKAEKFDNFIANSGISEEDAEDILSYKDLLIEKGMYEARHFSRAIATYLKEPPGPPLPLDRIVLILNLFNPSGLQPPGGYSENCLSDKSQSARVLAQLRFLFQVL